MASKNIAFKIFFMLFLTFFYTVRPMLTMPKKLVMEDYVNLMVVVCSDLLILKFWGPSAILYLFIASFSSIGPHPASLHVVAEHYEFVKGLESYDYLGFWNIINLNVGYHI